VTNDEPSLALDIDSVGKDSDSARVARIAVVGPRSCTRDGSADTITVDCQSLARLEREVERLRAELDAALRGAAEILGGGEAVASATSSETPASAGAREAPRVELELSVRDVMTRDVRSVDRNDSLAQARESMDAGGFRHLVVLGDGDDVVGVLSQRDIFFGPLAWSMGQGRHAYEASLAQAFVKDVMHEDVRTIDPGTPLQAAAREMLEHRIGCLARSAQPIAGWRGICGSWRRDSSWWARRTRHARIDVRRSPSNSARRPSRRSARRKGRLVSRSCRA